MLLDSVQARPFLSTVTPHRHHSVTNTRHFASQVARCAVGTPSATPDSDWRKKAKPIKEGSAYPAKENCSHCGLCDTYYIAHVKDACAFLGSGAPTYVLLT